MANVAPPHCIKQLGETKARPDQVEKPLHLLSRPTVLFFKKCGQYEEFRGAWKVWEELVLQVPFQQWVWGLCYSLNTHTPALPDL